MNIVIAGAGTMGQYVARILSKENYSVNLIDLDSKKLEKISLELDVGTRIGSCTDWQILDELLEQEPDIFLALTDNDYVNLVSSSIAKSLGYPLTIARLHDGRYLNTSRLDFGLVFNVDHFIAPELLVAYEFYKYMISPGSLGVEIFAHGAVQLKRMIVPISWKKASVPISQLNLPKGVMVGLIHRISSDGASQVIFPHGHDFIFPRDEVTILGETGAIVEAHEYFGLKQKLLESVVIIGGSRTAVNLAKILEEKGIFTRLIEKDSNRCAVLAEQLLKTTVIHHDATDIDFLLSEKVSSSDLLVVSTMSDEFNTMMALLAKEAGCREVVVLLANRSYAPILKKLGIHCTPSPGMIAADKIVALTTSGAVSSIVSLYEGEAEIIEIRVAENSKVIGSPLSELGKILPKDFLIGVIQNQGNVMIADGNKVISPGDIIIVISHRKHIQDLEDIF